MSDDATTALVYYSLAVLNGLALKKKQQRAVKPKKEFSLQSYKASSLREIDANSYSSAGALVLCNINNQPCALVLVEFRRGDPVAALPGGKVSPEDHNVALATCNREVWEETNTVLDLARIKHQGNDSLDTLDGLEFHLSTNPTAGVVWYPPGQYAMFVVVLEPDDGSFETLPQKFLEASQRTSMEYKLKHDMQNTCHIHWVPLDTLAKALSKTPSPVRYSVEDTNGVVITLSNFLVSILRTPPAQDILNQTHI